MKILPIIKRIFQSGKSAAKAAEKVDVQTPIFSKAVSNPVESAAAASNQTKTASNFQGNILFELLDEFINTKARFAYDCEDMLLIVPGGERQRYYRYVGDEEFKKLLSGERITSSRPCHRGYLTDVTSNPDYGKIPTLGKYRLSFKDKPEFALFPPDKDTNSRIIEHNLKDAEYYIRGGYDISDIEKIEQKISTNVFKNIDFLG